MKVLRENLPWIVPSVAIVLAATGFFDRDSGDPQQPVPAAAEVASAPEIAETVEPAVVETAVVTATPEVAEPVAVEPVVEVTSAASSAALPSVGDLAQSAGVADVQTDQTNVSLQNQGNTLSPGENAASFFAEAQSRLNSQNTCRDDLRAIADQARVYFPSGGLNADAAGIEQARLIGIVAQNCPGVRIRIEGHSDRSGNPATNLKLSQERADAVLLRIAAAGIDTSMFEAEGMGDLKPSTATGPNTRAFYDRRVEFTVLDPVVQAAFTQTARFANAPACVNRLMDATESAKLFFSPRSISVSPDELDTAYQLAIQAAACPQARLRVVGHHSKAIGSNETVQTGILRAKALMTMLMVRGIPAEQIIIAAPSNSPALIGQGESSQSRIDFDVIFDG